MAVAGLKRLRKLRSDGARFARLGRLLWPHARPHRGLFGGGLAVSAVVVLAHVAQPWPLKWIFDVLGGHSAPLAHHELQARLAIFTGVYVAIALGGAIAEYWQLLALNGLGNRVMAAFRHDLFRHVLRQPLAWHEKKEVGEMLTRVVSDTARLRRGVNGVLLKSVHTVAVFLATAGVLLWLNPSLAGVAALTGIAGLLLMGGTGRRILRAARKQREKEGRLAGVVEESLAGVRELQMNRPEASADPRFDRQNAKSLKEEQKVRRLEAKLFLKVSILLAASLCAVLYIGTKQVSDAVITGGDLVLFIHYLLALYRPFNVFAHQSARTGRTLACSERLVKILERVPAIHDEPDAVPAPTLRGDLAFENVTMRAPKRRRGSRKRILERVSFSIRTGERVAVIGPNGAGKSSLLLLVARLADPRSGRVVADGRDVRDYTIASYRRQLSSVQQEPAFFGLTVAENLALGMAEPDFERVKAAAARSSAIEVVERLPQRWETRMRRRGRLFSAGERQRLAVARALAKDGAVWLLDEPTAGLDTEASESITALLKDVTKGKTTFWVTHDPDLAMTLDRVLLLVKGKLRFNGSPQDLRTWLAENIKEAKTPSLRRYLEQLRAAA